MQFETDDLRKRRAASSAMGWDKSDMQEVRAEADRLQSVRRNLMKEGLGETLVVAQPRERVPAMWDTMTKANRPQPTEVGFGNRAGAEGDPSFGDFRAGGDPAERPLSTTTLGQMGRESRNELRTLFTHERVGHRRDLLSIEKKRTRSRFPNCLHHRNCDIGSSRSEITSPEPPEPQTKALRESWGPRRRA